MREFLKKLNGSHFLSFKAIQREQFGKNVITMQCTVDEIIKFFEIDREVQRDLDSNQVSAISKYIQYGLEGNDIYFPPLLFSAREQGHYDEEERVYKLSLNEKLIVLDGQHRLKAFQSLISRLETRSDSQSLAELEFLKRYPLTIQIFTNLTKIQERQLFTDINTKASTVSNTLIIMYGRDSLDLDLIKSIVYNHPSIPEEMFEMRARSTRNKLMTVSTLNNLIIVLNSGRLNTSLTDINCEHSTYDMYQKRTVEFLQLLVKYAPANCVDRTEYFMYVPSIIYGIGLFIWRMQQNNDQFDMEDIFKNVINKVNWKHSNKELMKYGFTFNKNTNRYNFLGGVRGSRNIANYLENESRRI